MRDMNEQCTGVPNKVVGGGIMWYINKSFWLFFLLSLSQDSDVTQEMVLRHHASISLLKRIFMEDMPMSAPSEWDRRISTYTPAVFPKLSNGDLFNGIDIVSLTHHKYWITLLCEINGSICPKQNEGLSLIHHWHGFIFQMGADGLLAVWCCYTLIYRANPLSHQQINPRNLFFFTAPSCHHFDSLLLLLGNITCIHSFFYVQ